ncbi:MAG: hypothetical protein HZA90_11750 [Verrucomicrobia bacterium]|nr:hypothetical protein [Verrucomicrobiota bacterium]
MTTDQFWSFCAMPLGLLICFAPVVLAWLLSGSDKPGQDKPQNRRCIQAQK